MYDKQPNVRGLESESYLQSGYFTATQARRHGVSRQLLNHHLRRGRFERVQHGLYRVWGFPRSQFDEIREKWMAVGEERAVISHESALLLLDLSNNVPDEVHLLVARRHRGLRRPPGVVIHTRPDEEKVATNWVDAMPITAPARTLVDVADIIQPDQAELAVCEALHLGLLTRRQLEREAERQRKTRVLEILLPDG